MNATATAAAAVVVAANATAGEDLVKYLTAFLDLLLRLQVISKGDIKSSYQICHRLLQV